MNLIKKEYGVTLQDGSKAWDLRNAKIVYQGLGNINTSLYGDIRSFSDGAVFTLSEHHPTADDPLSRYHGSTSGTTITFFTTGNETIRQMNLYHEFGHVMNASNQYSNALDALRNPSFVTNAGFLDTNALISERVYDPTYGTAQAIQHPSTSPVEQWADIFANFVANNINHSPANIPGSDMYDFITGVLAL